MAADKPRNTAFAIHGHMWKEQPKDFHSRVIPLQGGISIGNRFDMELLGGRFLSWRLSISLWCLEMGFRIWYVGDFSGGKTELWNKVQKIMSSGNRMLL